MNNIIDCTQVSHYTQRIPQDLCQQLSAQLVSQSQNTATIPRSNPGCWRGRCELTTEQDQEISQLITNTANEYITSLPLPKDLDRAPYRPSQWSFFAWGNVNDSYSNNVIHMHGSSMITLVLYLQGTGTGAIRFHPIHYLTKVYRENWPYNGDWAIEPNDGDIIVFPSYLLHTVETNLHPSRQRICIAVNADLV